MTIYFIWKYKSLKLAFIKLDEITGQIWVPREIIAKPKKRVNKNEERCREIFERIFNTKFVSVRPSWLKNPLTKHNLELDGYCESIVTPIGRGLAFEYDGEQHSSYTPHFHRNGKQDWHYQVLKDDIKDSICKHRKVMLIRIPSFVPYLDLERYIRQELHKRGVLPRT